jgi:hypothetical protein
MSKKTIAIDINEVIRALWMQFDRYYVEEFGEEGTPEEGKEYVYDFWENYEWKDTEETINYLNEELPDNINPLDYQIDKETGKAAVDGIAFLPEKEKLTAREVYNRFMYQDFCYEIFGCAQMMYKNNDLDLQKFFLKYNDQFEIILFSKENYFSIPSTLFFLSKFKPRIQKYFFVDEETEIWEHSDIVITTSPNLISNKPVDKTVIKIERPYNTHVKGDYEKIQIKELIPKMDDDGNEINNDEFDQLIGYEKTEENG